MHVNKLKPNGTIGIICPSHIFELKNYSQAIDTLEKLGFKLKFGANVAKETYGYAASAKERADDLNAMVSDDSIEMILFGGGEGAIEILPLIDYDNIKEHPKLFCSYSDGTSIINAIFAQTGLVTYYGSSPRFFFDLRHYDYLQFYSHFVEGYEVEQFISNSKWKTLTSGICEGTLIGGYASLFGLMLSNKYFKYDVDKKYLLFLEDHEKYSSVGALATYLAFIEQSMFMQNVTGLIFGHYANEVPTDLLGCLERFGTRNNIPVVYTDDFGHGSNHAILPIGIDATLDTEKEQLRFERLGDKK